MSSKFGARKSKPAIGSNVNNAPNSIALAQQALNAGATPDQVNSAPNSIALAGLVTGVWPPKPTTTAPVKPQAAAPVAPKAAAPAYVPPDFKADPDYQATVARLTKDFDDTDLALVGEETNQKKAFGYDDSSDPYSRAAQLRERLIINRRASGNSMAAAGQLYSGAYQNADNDVQEDYNRTDDATRKEYQAVLADIARRRRDAKAALGDALDTAGGNTITRLLAERPDPGEAADEVPADVAIVGAPEPALADPAAAQATAKATADATARAQAQAAKQASQNAAKPKPGYQFVQDSGTRKGLSFNVVAIRGKNYRRYSNGETIPQ